MLHTILYRVCHNYCLLLIFVIIFSSRYMQGCGSGLILTGSGSRSGSNLSGSGSGSRHLCLEHFQSILWRFLIRNCWCLFHFLPLCTFFAPGSGSRSENRIRSQRNLKTGSGAREIWKTDPDPGKNTFKYTSTTILRFFLSSRYYLGADRSLSLIITFTYFLCRQGRVDLFQLCVFLLGIRKKRQARLQNVSKSIISIICGHT